MPIIRSIRCWVAAYGFLHRVFGWVVVLRAAVCAVRMVTHIECSWWWAYVPETCRAKNTLIKLPCCIKLAFHIISWGRCTVKQPSRIPSSINFLQQRLPKRINLLSSPSQNVESTCNLSHACCNPIIVKRSWRVKILKFLPNPIFLY